MKQWVQNCWHWWIELAIKEVEQRVEEEAWALARIVEEKGHVLATRSQYVGHDSRNKSKGRMLHWQNFILIPLWVLERVLVFIPRYSHWKYFDKFWVALEGFKVFLWSMKTKREPSYHRQFKSWLERPFEK
jgi:hypothetical protein